MKKTVIIIFILIGVFSFKSYAQSEYFYEFTVPSVLTKTDEDNVTKLLNEIGIYDLRVVKKSKRVLCFSYENIPATKFTEKLNNNNYFIFFFNSGVQGAIAHQSKSLEEWNNYNLNRSTEKVFVAISLNAFSSTQKSAIKMVLTDKLKTVKLKYSENSKKLLIYTEASVKREHIKQLLYSYKSVNKLNDLVEIYK